MSAGHDARDVAERSGDFGGAAAFLQQAHRNNWQQYLASLRPDARRGWDLCILTASDERQAAMYRRQLDWRGAAGLLPACTRFLVLPDPGGRRIGSGGATLRALAKATGELEDGRVLIIHSGGDSRRLPHCSASGKLFARVPRVLPDGRASTIFDEFLISLSGLALTAPPGALIASGDVLLIFDHLQLSFQRPGVIGVAAAAPAEMGLRHGVYVSGDGGRRVRVYLHKAARPELERWQAIDADGAVQIDTGLVWLDRATVEALADMTTEPMVAAANLNLYGDLLLPLARSTTRKGYLADSSDGPATLEVQRAREVIWERLRGTPFTVERLQPAVFVHFGTTYEYWRMVAADAELAHLCDWVTMAASWARAEGDAVGQAMLVNATVEASLRNTEAGARVLVVDSELTGDVIARGPAIIAGVRSGQRLRLPTGVVVHQTPLTGGGYVTRVFGLHDDPKRVVGEPTATFLNRPWPGWMLRLAEAIWPGVDPGERTLWNARLYPAEAEREESLRAALELLEVDEATEAWRGRWLQAPRFSLAESFLRADGERILADVSAIEDLVAAHRFYPAVVAEQPAAEAAPLLGAVPAAIARRCELAADWLAQDDPIVRLRGYKALAVATGDASWEDRAFNVLAAMIEEATRRVERRKVESSRLQVRGFPASPVRVSAAARIDFGGGWTDTPPYSIERGGTVLNAAVTLRGAYPIVVAGEWLAEPRLILESCDIDATVEPAAAGEVLNYANPADPFALLKAALVLHGIVPADSDPQTPLAAIMRRWGRGLRLSTQTSIPRGSGLGTSSIMAGAVLACLARLTPSSSTEDGRWAPTGALFDAVLTLEQMLTTGGGWQDQVGGLVGGIKLVTTPPGLPQRIQVEPVTLAPATRTALAERLLLVYTGQQRLAKNLLRAVMGRWMARDPEMVAILREIARLALAMRAALEVGDLDQFGALIGEHWEINKRMDPGCTNPFIDGLMDAMRPLMCGAKLAGAGGGGFAIVIARAGGAAHERGAWLARRYPGTPVAIWPCAIPEEGMKVQG